MSRTTPLGMLILLAGFVCAVGCLPCGAADGPVSPESYGVFDFPTCFRYSLVHSEAFVNNKLEIQIKSIDVKDAHGELFPTLQLQSRYYIVRAGGGTGRMSVNIFMTNWNPYLALLKMKASGILVDIAKTNHRDKISSNVGEMAKLFYGIHMLEKTLRSRKQVAALQQDRLDFGKSRSDQGALDPLEFKSWENALRSSRVKIKDIQAEIDDKVTQLKTFMGYHPDFHLPLETRDAANQVLSGFNGRFVTFADVQGGNHTLKIAAKKEQLQSQLVTASYVAILPKPGIVVENVSNQVDRTSGFNLAIGLDYTIWDGFSRVRDIKRQKLKGEQIRIERSALSEKLYALFKKARSSLEIAAEREGLAREYAHIAGQAEVKAFTGYKGGNIGYEDFLQKRIDKAEAELEAVRALQERVVALIELATMAGGLDRYNAGLRH